MYAEDKFREIYEREPETTFCPYRVCPLGAHIDHQEGPILGFALDYGVHMTTLGEQPGPWERNISSQKVSAG